MVIEALLTYFGVKFFTVGLWGIGIYCFYDDQMSDERRP